MKKAQDGAKSKTSLGMRSVKSGYDNNSGVTRADFIPKKAKSGTKIKKAMSGYGGKAASMVPTKAKNGKPVKKAFLGAIAPLAMKALPMLGGMLGGKGKGGGGGGLGGMLGGLLGKNGKSVKKSKSGGSMKKCKGGC
jgi:hypothetical protein